MEAVIVALVSLATAAGGWWVGRHKQKADAHATIIAAVTAATAQIQDRYQELIADAHASASASAADAKTAREASREALTAAQDAESQAFRAEMHARAMARFLTELRPLIADHVPDAAPILERLDGLTARRTPEHHPLRS